MQNEVADKLVSKPPESAVRLCWHVITSEYPPQSGGVSDYTSLLAAGLAERGDEVHVWCPVCPGALPTNQGIAVHRQFVTFSPAELQRVGKELDCFPGPRRVLVQWVPHGYGYRSMNVGFCWWLWKRAKRHGDRLELMVHEPSLPFRWGSPRQNAAALVHRLMTMLLLHAAKQVWMSIPGWEPRLRPFAFGRQVRFEWLPIFSNVPIANNPARAREIRRRYVDQGDPVLIGHFGTFGPLITALLEPILLALAGDPARQSFLLMGQGSEQFREELIRKQPRLAALVHASGQLPAEELSYHLTACDVLIQPYPDGVSSRRTSFMAGLSHGKPMVTTTGELTEILWSQSNAVALAPSGDTRAFVERVRQLSVDAAERLRVGAAARRLYQERFDSAHIIETLRQAETTKDRECAFS
jgi:glycosyltransferase involved in cell wall biosynthesis